MPIVQTSEVGAVLAPLKAGSWNFCGNRSPKNIQLMWR